jgi:myo-inositol-1(or 4)-monophosphatase
MESALAMAHPLMAPLADSVRAVGAFIRAERDRFSIEDVETKGHTNDLVSYVDRTAEEMLRTALSRLTPGCGFIGEEGGSQDASGDTVWIIDPLDGTTNFVFGIPVFSVSVALYRNGSPELGIVYEVNQDELFWAVKGGGAWLNDRPIRVAADRDLAHSLLATGFPYNDFSQLPQYLEMLTQFLTHTRGLRRLGSAAVDLAYVACGRFDGFFERGLKPWDVAAGALIVQEAGGTVTDFAGGPNYLHGATLLASNGRIHPEMRALVTRS